MASKRGVVLRWTIATVVLAGTLAVLPTLEEQARTGTVLRLLDEASKQLAEELPRVRPADGGRFPAVLVPQGEAGPHLALLSRRLDAVQGIEVGQSGEPLVVDLRPGPEAWRLELTYGPASRFPASVEADTAPVHPWSILPALLAIVLAFASGRLVLSLLASILVGGMLAIGLNPIRWVPHAAQTYFWDATLADTFKLWIIIFTTALIGLVQLAARAGGIQGIVDRIALLARGRRSTSAATMLMGLAVFFDDYANTILVGTTMRPLTDRLRISREKLAYLVDSTSAPVAGVAIISTWIGYEVGLFGDLAAGLGLEADGYQLFFSALPYRFYCLFTLAFLVMLVVSGRDYGPMLKAERRAVQTGEVLREGSKVLSARGFEGVGAADGIPRLAHVALLPVGTVIAGAVFGLLWDGGGFAAVAERPTALFAFATWRDAFGAAENSTRILGLSSLAGTAVLFVLVAARRLLPLPEAGRIFVRGVVSMYPAVAILVLAWGIKAVCDDLGTSHFLVAGLQDAVSPELLPLIIFLLAAVVAFATGTSWGTMGILIPTAVPLAYHLAGIEGMYVTMAAVLDGAIFGDHCSPISDTTVMSSIASGSDHLDHVRTQIPYALTTMTAAALGGYLWWAAGWAYALGALLALLALGAVVVLVGRRPEAVPARSSP